MHASDALISPTVGIATGIAAAALIAVASRKVRDLKRRELVPLMGVMGAFVFAAQMINFTIPGTGSSGHLIGGVLLSAMLGPWCGFLTLCSIIMVQCLFFADGGLMALGCNIMNMAAASCLIAYPLVYRPLSGTSVKPWRIFMASVMASVVALEIGAVGVTAETELSGVTALPLSTFSAFMLPIHFVIGIVEGIVTGALLVFLANYEPSALIQIEPIPGKKKLPKGLFIGFGILTLVLAGGFTILASQYPDGLEWSIEKAGGLEEIAENVAPTALMPEYNSGFAGIVGALIVMVILWAVSSLIFHNRKKTPVRS